MNAQTHAAVSFHTYLVAVVQPVTHTLAMTLRRLQQVRAHSAELPGTDGRRCLGEGSLSARWRGRERRLQKVTQLWM